MFTQQWRAHWGLRTDPFACEDADKDLVLAEMDSSAVHSAFDRIFGSPHMPAPGIVFGEKGSGKSGLRLMMRRRLEEHNASSPDRVFVIEYIDFNPYLEHFRGADSRSGEKLLGEWKLADHLDCLLSLATSKLVGLCLDESAGHEKLSRKQKVNLLLLAALYYDSRRRTAPEAIHKLRLALRVFDVRTSARLVGLTLLVALGIALALLPHLVEASLGPPQIWYAAGATLAGASLLVHALDRWRGRRSARKAVASVRILARDAEPLAAVVRGLPARERAEFPLPQGDREEVRFELLERLQDLTTAFGYSGWYVLMDRVDEPSLLSGDAVLMSRFVEKLLDVKLLQYPGLALKLFLPIELERLHRSASPEAQKSMRLDKSNLVPELSWSGRELYEIANARIRSSAEENSRVRRLEDLFEERFDLEHLFATLSALATPRYGFAFLSAVVQEHLKELPGELSPDDPAWRIPRTRFDVVRAGWLDRAGVLRRSMN